MKRRTTIRRPHKARKANKNRTEGYRYVRQVRRGPSSLPAYERPVETDLFEVRGGKAKRVKVVKGSREAQDAAISSWLKQNPGVGFLFDFHGAFANKKDAEAKEAKTEGAFIKPIYYKSGMRYAVLTPATQQNPRQICGRDLGRGFRCTRRPKHVGPCLPKGVTLRPFTQVPKALHNSGKLKTKNPYYELEYRDKGWFQRWKVLRKKFRTPDGAEAAGKRMAKSARAGKTMQFQIVEVTRDKRNPLFSSGYSSTIARSQGRSRHSAGLLQTKKQKRIAGMVRKHRGRGRSAAPAGARADVVSALRNLGYSSTIAKSAAARASGSDFDSLFRSAQGSLQRNPYGDPVHKKRKVSEIAFSKFKKWQRLAKKYGTADARTKRAAEAYEKAEMAQRASKEEYLASLRNPKRRKAIQGAGVREIRASELAPWARRKMEEFEARLKAEKNPAKRRQLLSNPDPEFAGATAMYRKFHGRGPNKVVELPYPDADDKTLAELGRLEKLGFKHGFEITWADNEAPKLAANAAGSQLYLVGGNQNISESLRGLGLDLSKEFVDLGECTRVEYFTRKGFDDFQPVTYWHKLGEETGVRPHVIFDRTREQLIFTGGAYKVKPEGIVN